MFTWDRFQIDLVRKLDRIDLLFPRDCSGTGPKQVQMDPTLDLLTCRSSFGSVSIWICTRLVPKGSMETSRSHFGPVLCKRRIRRHEWAGSNRSFTIQCHSNLVPRVSKRPWERGCCHFNLLRFTTNTKNSVHGDHSRANPKTLNTLPCFSDNESQASASIWQ